MIEPFSLTDEATPKDSGPILPGSGYNAAETTPLPTGWDLTDASCDDDPYGGEEVTFHNTPLTNVTVSVDSQVDGGTASTIDCDGTTETTDSNGDAELTLNDLEPTAPDVTLTCEVTIDP